MNNNIAHNILEQAEDWHKVFQQSQGTEDQREDFKAWYHLNPDHQIAYAQVFTSYDSGYDIDKISTEYIRKKQAEKYITQKSFWSMTTWKYASIAAIILLVVTTSKMWQAEPVYTEYITLVGEMNKIKLTDGSIITLGAQSKIRVEEFSEQKRHVIIDRGEALFAVAKDKSRPFIVSSDKISIRVLGTIFNINKSKQDITVSLLEGNVQVIQEIESKLIPFWSDEKIVNLKPAQQVSVKQGALKNPIPQNIGNMATWVDGQLNYNGTLLREVVADLNRYSLKLIEIDSQSLNYLPVTAVFGTDQIELMVQGLPHLLPIELIQDNPDKYILRAKSRF